MIIWLFWPHPLEHTHLFLRLGYLGKLPLTSPREEIKATLSLGPRVGPCLSSFQLQVIINTSYYLFSAYSAFSFTLSHLILTLIL